MRYAVFLGIGLGAAAFYLPFRLAAASLNNVTIASTGDFYHRLAVIWWPLFCLVLFGLPSALGALMRIHVAARVVAVIGFLLWVDYSRAVDSLLGLEDWGRTGLNSWRGTTFNTTYVSAEILSPLFMIFGILAGTVAGVIWRRVRRAGRAKTTAR